MPELFRLLARNAIVGVLAGWVTLALLIVTDTAGFGSLVYSAANPFLPVAVLGVGLSITFGSIAMGVAIMIMPYDRDEGKRGGLKVHTLLAAARALVPAARRMRLQPVSVKGSGRSERRRG